MIIIICYGNEKILIITDFVVPKYDSGSEDERIFPARHKPET